MKRIGFIGIGNMGGAMARACATLKEAKVTVYDINPQMYQGIDDTIEKASTIKDLVQTCDLIVLSIKPQYYQSVIDEIKEMIEERQLLITVSPSHSLEKIQQLFGKIVHVIRTMPNTPALIGQGVTAYCYEEQMDEALLKDFKTYFESFGTLLKVPESLMPAIVATTGSSPAYIYLFIEAMADAAVSFGLPRAMAYEMVAKTLIGSAQMVLQTGKHPGELKDAVTSPAGTTIDAVIALEEAGFRNSIIKGMQACYHKVYRMS